MFRLEKLFVIILVALLYACGSAKEDQPLGLLGPKKIVTDTVNGKVSYDTIYHKIADFRFVDQDSNMVTNNTFKGKIYIADFFFTTCPTICPKMNAQLVRVYDKFKDNPNVKILSHTIDPAHDTVAVLKHFADRLGVSSDTWHFVTGSQDDIYEIGQNSYMVTAMEDKSAPGGFLHNGALILVDPERRVRGIYDGTVEDDVNRLMDDIPKLMAEYGMH
jgi:protein SCO1/2